MKNKNASALSSSSNGFNRRAFLTGATLAGAALAVAKKGTPRDWTGKTPTRYPEPDVVVLDKRFGKYKLGNSPIQRLYTSPKMLWAEGPAWNGVGRYLLWSDIPNNVQMRWLDSLRCRYNIDGFRRVYRGAILAILGIFDWSVSHNTLAAKGSV